MKQLFSFQIQLRNEIENSHTNSNLTLECWQSILTIRIMIYSCEGYSVKHCGDMAISSIIIYE